MSNNNKVRLNCLVEPARLDDDQVAGGEDVEGAGVGPLQLEIDLVLFVVIGDVDPSDVVVYHIFSIANGKPKNKNINFGVASIRNQPTCRVLERT